MFCLTKTVELPFIGDLAFLLKERRLNMKNAKFLTMIILLAFSLPFTYGSCGGGSGGSGGDGGDGGDPCAGPVPCLTEDWGNTFYEFVDQGGAPSIILSDGIIMGFGGIYFDELGDPYPIAFAGPVISCHDGDLTEGAIDWNLNGNVDPDEWLDSVDGALNICNVTLSIYDLVVEGEPWSDYEATYVGSGTLSLGEMIQEETESPKDLLHELIQIMSTEWF